jgi:integrase
LKKINKAEKTTIHGLRATGSTILNEMNFNKDWIERALAHVPTNKVRAAYNRAEYLTNRADMLQQRADLIDMPDSKIVPIRKGAK